MPLRYNAPYVVNEPPVHPSQASKFTWTSAAGRVTSLADFDSQESGIFVPPGTQGLGMPRTTFYETNSPTFDGSTVHGHRVEPRDIALPIIMYGKDRNALRTRWRRMVDDFRPNRTLGPGTLTLTQYDGESRSIQAWLTGGLEGNDDDQQWGLHWISDVATLHCPLPYWIGETVTQTFSTTGNGSNDPDPDPNPNPNPGTRTFYPLLPLVLAGGLPTSTTPDPEEPEEDLLTAAGPLKVNYTGNAVCYPVWSFTGPCDTLRLTNTETGQYFQIAGGVAAGRTLTIDTREQFRTVVETIPGAVGAPGSAGSAAASTVNRYGDVSGVLWSLVEGENIIEISAPGIAVDSNLKVTWQQRFQTGY